MLFNSRDFLVFFPVVVLLYFIIPKKLRHIWLLAASYYFYMSWNAKYAVLIAMSTLITWVCGIFIERLEGEKKSGKKKCVLALAFISNLGILFFFKYFDFLLQIVNMVLRPLNMEMIDNPFDIILPVGISFYTFQALGYTVDVYRGKISAEKNILNYALFVSFFPQLVAGPIERSESLLNQIRRQSEINVWDYERVVKGLIMMLWGLFIKMVIADRIAVVVDTVFDSPYRYGASGLIAAAAAFSMQIYCDFSAYSIIAIGAAKVLGFSLMENFNVPYFARSIADFWHRWHISLSTWFRDYLYIPLGGSRCSRIKKYRNIMITFLVSGLWHGAGWTFVIWGGLHGLYQIVGDMTRGIRNRINDVLHINTNVFSYKFGQVVGTYILTTFAWIFFRADTLQDAIYYIFRIFRHIDPWALFDESLYTLGLDRFESNVLIVALLVLLAVDLLKYFRNINLSDFLMAQNLVFRWIVIIGLIAAVLTYGMYGTEFDSAQFIYFEF